MPSAQSNPFRLLGSPIGGYLIAIVGVALATALLAPFNHALNPTLAALSLLLVVLFTATGWGSRPALVASALGVFAFNFFFLPPFYTLTIADPQNWAALVAFLITAVTVGELSGRARRRADEAEAGQRRIAELYHQLESAFEQASQAEALRRSEQIKSAMLDAVAHDLRTPLTSIKVSATTLLAENDATLLDDEGRRELLEVIDEEADRLHRFIEGMVELARVEAGQAGRHRSWGSAEEIIETALARADPLTIGHHVEIEIERELPALRVDARALAQAVFSLVENAAKYAPRGSQISVTARRVLLALDEQVEIAIADEGPGIAPELRERVFDKFFRAPGPAQTAGLGMGLSIARGIVEAHSGSVRVEAGADGRGARFVLLIPIGDDEAGAEAE